MSSIYTTRKKLLLFVMTMTTIISFAQNTQKKCADSIKVYQPLDKAWELVTDTSQ
jgi:hypothetical protein